MEYVEHLIIQMTKFFTGTAEQPKIQVFIRTHKTHPPLNEDKIHLNDRIGMKWSDDPTVAQVRIVSWHSGQVENGNINSIRERTVGTALDGLDKY